MRIFVGVTDPYWYKFNYERNNNQVVFWRKSSRPLKLKKGDYFFFLIRGKLPRKISGYGIVSEVGSQKVDWLWREYGEKNGCNKIKVFEHLINKNSQQSLGYSILDDVCYFDSQECLTDLDIGFKKDTVVGKFFNYDSPAGKILIRFIQKQ